MAPYAVHMQLSVVTLILDFYFHGDCLHALKLLRIIAKFVVINGMGGSTGNKFT